MPLSRRDFMKVAGVATVGAAGIPFIVGRGSEAAERHWSHPGGIRLNSNENPRGPSARALAAIRDTLSEASRYADMPSEELRNALAAQHRVDPANVLLGCGSGEILRMAVYSFTSRDRPLVCGSPTFELPATIAGIVGAPVRAVRVDSSLRLDLAGMVAQCDGAGLVFLCNPNNPTATAHTAAAVQDFVRAVDRRSPETTILVDEAYFEFVDLPGYETMIPLAAENPRVVVSRTFSKIYGMAGLRVGYAVGHERTIAHMAREQLKNNVNQLAAAAARASLGERDHLERERQLNREAKEFTRRFFAGAGYTVVPSETNFMMVDIRRDTKEFQDACRARGVLVGRPFPPLVTHLRISMGTLDEMRQAADVFKHVLSNA